ETGQKLLQAVQRIPGIVDPHIVQVLDYPALQVDVDRLRAARLGVTQRDIANDLLTSLSSSALVAPSFFLNPQNGVNYNVAVQMPIDKMTSVADLMDIAVSKPVTDIAPASGPIIPTSLPRASVTRLSDVAAVRPKATFQSV